jgi:hypothetical protein
MNNFDKLRQPRPFEEIRRDGVTGEEIRRDRLTGHWEVRGPTGALRLSGVEPRFAGDPRARRVEYDADGQVRRINGKPA